MASLYMLPTKLSAVYKTFKFKRNIQALLQLTEDLNDSEIFQPIDKRQKLLIQSNLGTWQFVFYIMWIFSAGGLIFNMFLPLLDKTEPRKLLFPSWYPYDSSKSPFYELTYIYQAVSINFIGLININIDLFISALNMFIGCQFDLLCEKLCRMKENEGKR